MAPACGNVIYIHQGGALDRWDRCGAAQKTVSRMLLFSGTPSVENIPELPWTVFPYYKIHAPPLTVIGLSKVLVLVLNQLIRVREVVH